MIPTVEFNIIFQLTHIYSHLMNEGIGLRQLVDYYYVLCDFYKVYQNFSKTHPSSLTLKGGSTAFPKPLFNGLYTPFGPPLAGDRNLREEEENRPTVLNFLPLRLSCKESSTSNQAFLLRRKDVTALRCSEPLRSKVGGPSKVFAMVLRDGTAWGEESL